MDRFLNISGTFNYFKLLENEMEKTGRIIEDKVEVSDKNVHDFFENRVNKKLFHRYNLVNYQDNNPELALERDVLEKNKILPMLSINADYRVLDIGCGVGRWGDALSQILTQGVYVGVDYSAELIKVAKEYSMNDVNNNRKYLVGSFQNLTDVLKDNGVDRFFDVVLINGVLMYINDSDIDRCLGSISGLVKSTAKVYIKESVSLRSRLTLKEIFSNELGSVYSAIYRGKDEYDRLIRNNMSGFSVLSEGATFEETNLNNRKETTSYYWILSPKM
jgi:ubiquinone/menaquinone biosynthesis C-methylase UbiE